VECAPARHARCVDAAQIKCLSLWRDCPFVLRGKGGKRIEKEVHALRLAAAIAVSAIGSLALNFR
jgi:hypothetical protein